MSPVKTLLDIRENFQFLISQVLRQIDDCFAKLKLESSISISKFEARDNYVDILKSIIEQKSYSRLTNSGDDLTDKAVEMIKAINKITTNLERIGDFAVNILRQLKYFKDEKYLKQYNLDPFHEAIRDGILLIEKAMFQLDISSALDICRKELLLDELFEENFQTLMQQFKDHQEHHGNLITTLFIFRYFERTGDALLNIGEAIISATLGERLKIHQYIALEESLESAEEITHSDELQYQSIAETKSGSRIGLITDDTPHDGPAEIIFKNGDKKKIQLEKELIEHWEKLFPGLPPKVYGFQEHKRDASLLLQYLDGRTIQDLIINGTMDQLNEAMHCLFKNMANIWTQTKEDVPVNGRFMLQLSKRLQDVYAIHPEFSESHMKIGTLKILSLDYLSKKALEINEELESPFSILIHGDFNSDNILYSFDEKKINYIDLHRSRLFDYVQDVSVFLVSNFRLPFVDEATRDIINWISENFLEFTQQQAKVFGDSTFDVRLALGLIRSFITSTRFVLNKNLAKTMYHRGVYLLEQVVNYDGKYEDYTLPKSILFF
jgi:phosphate uptake regulator